MGIDILENIYSDRLSYESKIKTSTPSNELEEVQNSVDSVEETKSEESENGDEHLLNAALAKLELAEEKQRKPHKRVFEIIDKEKKGMISREQLQSYIREILQVLWTPAQVELVNNYFDPTKTGKEGVTLLDIIDRLSFNRMLEKKDALKAYSRISLHGFILCLREAWRKNKLLQKESLMILFEKYDENSDQVLSLQE